MALLLKNDAVFLHVPKTGGSWVTAVLEELGLVRRRFGHIHADAMSALRLLQPSRMLRDDVAAYAKSFFPVTTKQSILRRVRRLRSPGSTDVTPFMFCFVRDPLDWYVSYWKYMCDMHWLEYGSKYDPYDWHPWALLNGLGSNSFDVFIRNILRERPGYVTEMYGWYARPCVNFVGKQETLVDDLIRVLRLLNVLVDEDRVRSFGPTNVSRGPKRGVRWDPHLRADVAATELAGRRRFGYADS